VSLFIHEVLSCVSAMSSCKTALHKRQNILMCAVACDTKRSQSGIRQRVMTPAKFVPIINLLYGDAAASRDDTELIGHRLCRRQQ
jgi:hypothetical protein